MDKLYLHFYSGFPADIAGELVELDPNTKGNGKEDSFWIFGTIHYADVRLRPKPNQPIDENYRTISRLHFTIKYESKTGLWAILDGAVYVDEKASRPGKFPIRPSANGVWHNGERLRHEDWQTIKPGDHIYLGANKKIIVRASEFDTLDDEVWLAEWHCGPEKSDAIIPVRNSESEDLHKKAQSNASPWTLLEQLFCWLKEPSKSRQEQFMKYMLVGSGIAIALSTELRDLINWLINR